MHLFEMQEVRGDDVIPFTPTWVMLDDWMIMTLVPHAMKEVVLRAEMPTTGGGLAAQEDFRSLQDVLPEDPPAVAAAPAFEAEPAPEPPSRTLLVVAPTLAGAVCFGLFWMILRGGGA